MAKKKDSKLTILKQSRERTLMPRPTAFKEKKKYDRNNLKDEMRKDSGSHKDD